MSEISNYIPISRKLFESWLWLEKREFSRAEAWVDLLRRVRFEANSTKLLIQGKMVEIHRGEIPASLRLLAEWWGWSKNRVDKFLDILEKECMIKKRTAIGTAQTVITICNYDKYNFSIKKSGQQKGQSRDSDGTATGQSRDNTNKDNKVNKTLESTDVDSLSGDSPPDVSDHINYKKFVEWFNSETKGVFGIVKYPLGEKRKASIRARVREFGKKSLFDVVKKAYESDFLKESGFMSIDWMIKPSNFEKILSGNYNKKVNGTNQRNSKTGGQRPTTDELDTAVEIGIALAEANKNK